jgi:cytochrome P450
MPPHSFLFGHLLVFGKMAADLPEDAHGHSYCRVIRKTYPDLPENFYVDLWPFGEQYLMVTDPKVAAQCTIEHSLPKMDGLEEYLRPLTGGKDLLTMEGQEWKRWRAIYNPGFSAGHLMTMVPGMVEDTQLYAETLKKYARAGGLFKLEEITTRLTIDIIGRVILDTRMNAQTSTNDLLAGFRSQVVWLPQGDEVNPFKKYKPLRPFIYWYNTRRMNRWLSRELEARFASRKEVGQAEKLKRSKPVIDLALDTYLSESNLDIEKSTTLDATFKEFALRQIKLFMFAGHDTTSSTLCYMYYLLHKHPSCRAKLVAELDSVFGADTSKTAELIKNNPHLVNKLPYTTAVMKETLRLFPPASTLRQGSPTFTLSIPGDPKPYPTDGKIVWVIHQAMHRSSSLFPSPDSFIPERFLVLEGDPLYPVKGAWRPFEWGPRNCIGQEVAMLETRIIMALTVREFEIVPGYEEYDRSAGVRSKRLLGERAYQILCGSAKPAQGMPVRVTVRERGEGRGGGRTVPWDVQFRVCPMSSTRHDNTRTTVT